MMLINLFNSLLRHYQSLMVEILDFYFKVQINQKQKASDSKKMQIKVLDTYNNQQCVSIHEIDKIYNHEYYLKQNCQLKSCFQQNRSEKIKTIDLSSVIPLLKKIIRNGEFRQQVFKKIKRNFQYQENGLINYQKLQKFEIQNQTAVLKQANQNNLLNCSGSRNQKFKYGSAQNNETKMFLNHSTLGIEQTDSFLQLRLKTLTFTPRLIKDLFLVQEVNLVNLSIVLFAKFFYYNKEEIGRIDMGWIFVISYLLSAYLTQNQKREEISSKISEMLRIKKQNLMELSLTFLQKIEFQVQVSTETKLIEFIQSKLQKYYKQQ